MARPTTSTLGTNSIGLKTRCWKCGEPHYQRYFSIEKARVVRSSGPTTIGDFGKAHRIHAKVNNHKAEHESTILEMLGTIDN
jgi:hypothetical protein